MIYLHIIRVENKLVSENIAFWLRTKAMTILRDALKSNDMHLHKVTVHALGLVCRFGYASPLLPRPSNDGTDAALESLSVERWVWRWRL